MRGGGREGRRRRGVGGVSNLVQEPDLFMEEGNLPCLFPLLTPPPPLLFLFFLLLDVPPPNDLQSFSSSLLFPLLLPLSPPPSPLPLLFHLSPFSIFIHPFCPSSCSIRMSSVKWGSIVTAYMKTYCDMLSKNMFHPRSL